MHNVKTLSVAFIFWAHLLTCVYIACNINKVYTVLSFNITFLIYYATFIICITLFYGRKILNMKLCIAFMFWAPLPANSF